LIQPLVQAITGPERLITDITYLADLMREADTRPEIEIYDLGQLYNLRQLTKDGVLAPPFSLQFVLGVLGGSSSDPDHLIYLLRMAERLFGLGTFTWSAAGVGYPAEFELAALALMLGGNIRVGLEDNLRVHRTSRAKTNAELVTKAVTLAELFDKTPASPAEAREYLRLKGADRVAF
jgi:3,5-dioxohexanoate:acetyl-CoA acetone transferase